MERRELWDSAADAVEELKKLKPSLRWTKAGLECEGFSLSADDTGSVSLTAVSEAKGHVFFTLVRNLFYAEVLPGE